MPNPDPSLIGQIAWACQSIWQALINLAAMINLTPLELMIQAFIVATGLIGQILVGKKRILGFYFWLAGNVAIIIATIPKQLYGMALLYMIYNITTIYCILEWRRDERNKSTSAAIPSQATSQV